MKYELYINLTLKTDYFILYFLCKSDLRISTAEKHLGIIRIKHFEALENDNIIPIIDE